MTPGDPRTALVGAGYDAMVDTWEAWKAEIRDDPRAEWLDELVRRLRPRARVLELGCGGGTDETRVLADRFELVGVDLSTAQLARARERIPNARFLHADLVELDLEAATLDAVAAFYVLNHVPREHLAGLLARIRSWLRDDGLLLTTLGASDNPGWTGEWLGVPTHFSGFAPEENRRLLAEAAFESIRDELVTIREPEGEATFHWILARRLGET